MEICVYLEKFNLENVSISEKLDFYAVPLYDILIV
jgi:hypothetical protein